MSVSFPGLGIHDLVIDKVAFSVFGQPIYWYGITISLGFMLALAYAYFNHKRFNINLDKLLDTVVVATVAGIIGARTYYVVFNWNDYKGNPASIFDFRSGGLAIYGCVIFAFISAYAVCRIRKLNTLDFLDIGSLGFLIGQAVGRWGNFFNQEAYGRNTTLPWGMFSTGDMGNYGTYEWLARNQETLSRAGVEVNPELPVHPCFLYESLWCALGLVLLHFISKKRKFSGQIFLCYGIWYGAGRFFIEALRTDSLMFFGTSVKASQLVAVLAVVICGLMLAVNLNKLQKAGRQELADGDAVAEGGDVESAAEAEDTPDQEQPEDSIAEEE